MIRLSQVQLLFPFADHTAGDFLSGIAGRLGVEVIRMAVYLP